MDLGQGIIVGEELCTRTVRSLAVVLTDSVFLSNDLM